MTLASESNGLRILLDAHYAQPIPGQCSGDTTDADAQFEHLGDTDTDAAIKVDVALVALVQEGVELGLLRAQRNLSVPATSALSRSAPYW